LAKFFKKVAKWIKFTLETQKKSPIILVEFFIFGKNALPSIDMF
jgi:hypothetical protein